MKIGIFIFKNVEILDFTGPYEVLFNKILNINEIYKTESPFKVFTISSKSKKYYNLWRVKGYL